MQVPPRVNIDPAVAAAAASEFTVPAAREHMESFFECVFRFRNAGLMGFLETEILGLSNRERRCLASFGAVHGLASGQDWASRNLDHGNVIYASVWEAWKAELPPDAYPTATSITRAFNAGNVIEAMMGIVWLSEHEGPAMASGAASSTRGASQPATGASSGGALRDAASFRRLLAAEQLNTYNDVVSDAFLFRVITVGSSLRPWIPWLERAIGSYDNIYGLSPQMHCTRKTYDAETQFMNFEAVRLWHLRG